VPGRRPAIAAEAERRSRERRTRLGGEIRSFRTRRSWTQEQLADRAHLDRSLISRAERGVAAFDLDMLERLAVALDVPLNCGFGRDTRADVADAGHLAIQELVLRLGRQAGYTSEFELPTRPTEPWPSIDVALASRARRRIICVECWNTIGDIGAATRSSARKAAEAEAMALGLWGDAARARLVWVVRSTARNRALVGRYPEVFATRLPGSSKKWLAALTDGANRRPSRALFGATSPRRDSWPGVRRPIVATMRFGFHERRDCGPT
jgi:transcriptional regulator with XRE-family HTH domain